MNEIKAMEMIKWFDEEIQALYSEGGAEAYGERTALKKARDKFKSLITKDYEHGDHGA